jgi:hypothetical protein
MGLTPKFVVERELFISDYVRPAVDAMIAKLKRGEALSDAEQAILHALGPESEAWALNFRPPLAAPAPPGHP